VVTIHTFHLYVLFSLFYASQALKDMFLQNEFISLLEIIAFQHPRMNILAVKEIRNLPVQLSFFKLKNTLFPPYKA
jgi:hypothetical protein